MMRLFFFSDTHLNKKTFLHCNNSTYFVCVAPFWFYISMIKDGETAIMQNDYCTEHFDMTVVFGD